MIFFKKIISNQIQIQYSKELIRICYDEITKTLINYNKKWSHYLGKDYSLNAWKDTLRILFIETVEAINNCLVSYELKFHVNVYELEGIVFDAKNEDKENDLIKFISEKRENNIDLASILDQIDKLVRITMKNIRQVERKTSTYAARASAFTEGKHEKNKYVSLSKCFYYKYGRRYDSEIFWIDDINNKYVADHDIIICEHIENTGTVLKDEKVENIVLADCTDVLKDISAKTLGIKISDQEFEEKLLEEGNFEKNILGATDSIHFWKNGINIGFVSGKLIDEDMYSINSTMLKPDFQGNTMALALIPNCVLAERRMRNFWNRYHWETDGKKMYIVIRTHNPATIRLINNALKGNVIVSLKDADKKIHNIRQEIKGNPLDENIIRAVEKLKFSYDPAVGICRNVYQPLGFTRNKREVEIEGITERDAIVVLGWIDYPDQLPIKFHRND
ncbi:MAG: hypothetical protein KKA19_06720 [Candidatus Margulisbacteria bacterium]|nr:hypothetical protein [Candidatus Margulisiibacteriota bacterium]